MDFNCAQKMNKNKLLCSSRYVVLLRRIPVGSLLLGKPFQVFGYQVQLIPARPKPFAKADLRGYVKDQLSTGLTKHLALSQLLIHF